MLNLNKKVFSCISTSNNGDITSETLFFYEQFGNTIRAVYRGGNIRYGELIGMVNKEGVQEIAFNHIDANSQIHGCTGTFTPKIILSRLNLHIFPLLISHLWKWGGIFFFNQKM